MSIHEARDAAWEVRWHECGRNRSVRENGPYELAKKIERKRMSVRDEYRHSDVRHELNFKKSLDQKSIESPWGDQPNVFRIAHDRADRAYNWYADG